MAFKKAFTDELRKFIAENLHMSNEAIAEKFEITEKSVLPHRAHVIREMNALAKTQAGNTGFAQAPKQHRFYLVVPDLVTGEGNAVQLTTAARFTEMDAAKQHAKTAAQEGGHAQHVLACVSTFELMPVET